MRVKDACGLCVFATCTAILLFNVHSGTTLADEETFLLRELEMGKMRVERLAAPAAAAVAPKAVAAVVTTVAATTAAAAVAAAAAAAAPRGMRARSPGLAATTTAPVLRARVVASTDAAAAARGGGGAGDRRWTEPKPVPVPKPFEPADPHAMAPPAGYPRDVPLLDVVRNWAPDDASVPAQLHDTLRHFDYSVPAQRAAMLAYRNAELPFVVHNVPDLDAVVKKWTLRYVDGRMGKHKLRTEVSKNNHHMYFKGGAGAARRFPGWRPPMRWDSMSFREWLRHANVPAAQAATNKPHFYWRLDWKHENGPSQWVYEDLKPFFGRPPTHLKDFVVDISGHRGINCRAGMRGVIAEAHFDGSRNFIAMMKGAKRYVMMKPGECNNMYYYKSGHPSARHGSVDFSDPAHLDVDAHPLLKKARAFEVVLRAGEMLYIPTFWNHYIISLGLNIQCNTRSGVQESGPQSASRLRRKIHDCW